MGMVLLVSTKLINNRSIFLEIRLACAISSFICKTFVKVFFVVSLFEVRGPSVQGSFVLKPIIPPAELSGQFCLEPICLDAHLYGPICCGLFVLAHVFPHPILFFILECRMACFTFKSLPVYIWLRSCLNYSIQTAIEAFLQK